MGSWPHQGPSEKYQAGREPWLLSQFPRAQPLPIRKPHIVLVKSSRGCTRFVTSTLLSSSEDIRQLLFLVLTLFLDGAITAPNIRPLLLKYFKIIFRKSQFQTFPVFLSSFYFLRIIFPNHHICRQRIRGLSCTQFLSPPCPNPTPHPASCFHLWF